MPSAHPQGMSQYMVSTGSSSSVATSYCGQQLLKPETNVQFLSYFLQKGKYFLFHSRRLAATKCVTSSLKDCTRERNIKKKTKQTKTTQSITGCFLGRDHPESTVMAGWRVARAQPPAKQLMLVSWVSYPRVMPTILLAGKLRLSKCR